MEELCCIWNGGHPIPKRPCPLKRLYSPIVSTQEAVSTEVAVSTEEATFTNCVYPSGCVHQGVCAQYRSWIYLETVYLGDYVYLEGYV